METTRIEFEPFIDERVRQFIVGGIDYYNIAATGLPNYFPVNFVLRGECGDVLGGLLGQLWGGWLQVSYLWVAESARGVGCGTRLLKNAEVHAACLGAIGVALETYSFQARSFYERLGYEVFGTRKIPFEEGVGGLPTKINGALSDAARDFSRVLNFAMSDIGP